METLNLEITKGDLEAALPVATSKNDNILKMLQPYLETAATTISVTLLGDIGVNAVNAADATDTIVTLVKREVCLQTFLPNMRSLDAVLTSTGFGVVSTQDLTPASKARVDALESSLKVLRLRTESALLRYLFAVDGWGSQRLRRLVVPTLFFDFDMLSRYAGIDSPTANDWNRCQPLIREADLLLRRKISDDQMNTLLTAMCCHELTDLQSIVATSIVEFIGYHLQELAKAEHDMAEHILNTMEAHPDAFAGYMSSEAYQVNHFQGYENTKDSGMFIFQG